MKKYLILTVALLAVTGNSFAETPIQCSDRIINLALAKAEREGHLNCTAYEPITEASPVPNLEKGSITLLCTENVSQMSTIRIPLVYPFSRLVKEASPGNTTPDCSGIAIYDHR
jgi:hypothetical protein